MDGDLAVNGSAIRRTVTLEAGATVGFAWNFLTDESTIEDFAFVYVRETGDFLRLADTTSNLVPSVTELTRESGFKRFAFVAPAAGTYTFAIGVANVTDDQGDSGLLLDDFRVVAPVIAAPVLEVTGNKPGVLATLLDSTGRVVAPDAPAIDARGLAAGTYYLGVHSPSPIGPSPLPFQVAFDLALPGTAHGAYDRDLVNGGDGDDVVIGSDDGDRLFGDSGQDGFVGSRAEVRDANGTELVVADAANTSPPPAVPDRELTATDIPDPQLRRVIAQAIGIPVLDGAGGLPLVTRPIYASAAAQIVRLDAGWNGKTKIANLKGLEYLTQLQVLNLANNAITDLSPLAPAMDNWRAPIGLRNMAYLTLDGNPLTSLSVLAQLSHLRWLSAAHLSLGDAGGLVALAGLSELQYVDLHNNGVTELQSLAGLRVGDDGDAPYREDTPTGSTAWRGDKHTGAFDGDYRLHAPLGTGETVAKSVWTFSNLEPGAYYRVLVTWPEHETRSPAAAYTVFDAAQGGTSLRSTAINQRLAPSGTSFGGRPWQTLGDAPFATPASGTLRLELAADALGTVAADGVRLVRVDAAGLQEIVGLPALTALNLTGNPLNNLAHEAFLSRDTNLVGRVVGHPLTAVSFDTSSGRPAFTGTIAPQTATAGQTLNISLAGIAPANTTLTASVRADGPAGAGTPIATIAGTQLTVTVPASPFTGTLRVTVAAFNGLVVAGLPTGRSLTTSFDVFVNPQGATLYGTRWNDADRDAVIDANELGVEGSTVFLDLDSDGVFDAGEPTAVSDVRGDFRLQATGVTSTRSAKVVPVALPNFRTATTGVSVTIGPGQVLTGKNLADFRVLDVGPDRLGVEGTGLTFTATITDPDPANGNRFSTPAWQVRDRAQQLLASGNGTTFAFTPPDNGDYTVTASSNDLDDANRLYTDTLNVYAQNAAPTLIARTQTGTEGAEVVLRTADFFRDAGNADTQAFRWQAVADNGQAIPDGTASEFRFTPADQGLYTVEFTVTDDDGASVRGQVLTLYVSNVAPAASVVLLTAQPTEGQPVQLQAALSDASADQQAGFRDLLWSVTKAGVPDVYASGATQAFAFTPDDGGTYTITFTARDKDGAITAPGGVRTIAVANAPPAVSIRNAPASVTEGTTIALAAGVSDSALDQQAGFSYAWDVTKVHGATTTAHFATGTGPAFNFTPNDDGTYRVTLVVTDKDGLAGVSSTVTIQAADIPLSVSLSDVPAQGVAEGTTLTLGAQLDEPGAADRSGLRYAWDVTKVHGTTTTAHFASGTGDTLSFTPDDDGLYTVTLALTDKDNVAAEVVSQVIAVSGAAPTAVPSLSPAAVDEGQAFTFGLTNATDPAAADRAALQYAFDLDGDGTFEISNTAASTQSVTLRRSGTYRLQARVRDKDGISTDYVLPLVVRNRVPTVAVGATSVTVTEDTPGAMSGSFADPGDDAWRGWALISLVGSAESQLFPLTLQEDKTFAFSPVFGRGGTYRVQFQVTDDEGGGVPPAMPDTTTVTVLSVPDTPEVTDATTREDTLSPTTRQLPDGTNVTQLTIRRNPLDGAEVTHFQITSIVGGTLYQQDGVTAIAADSFITVAQGGAGLRFRPAPDRVVPGSFRVQASSEAADRGLGGTSANVTISIQSINDPPSFTAGLDVLVQNGLGPQVAQRWATNLQSGPADEAGQRLWFEVTSYDTNLLRAEPFVDARSGNLIVDPKPDAEGTALVTVVMHDMGGVEWGGSDISAPLAFRVHVQPSPLKVVQFAPQADGFAADFSYQLDLTALNLYDAEQANLGAPDVVVSRDGDVVPGSLVVDASSKQVRFLKTGGPLEPGTYTVVVRSGGTSFHDRNGRQLQGAGGGAQAGDYTALFVVPESPVGTVTVSLPDFVRGPGQPVNVPATASGLPVRIDEGANVRTVTFNLRYDPSLLSITGAQLGAGLPTGASVTWSPLEPGLGRLVFYSPTTLGAGPVTVATLQASVPTAAGDSIYLVKQVLDIQDLSVTSGTDRELPAIGDDGLQLVAYFGDVTGNGGLAAQDAAQVARLAAVLDAGFAATPSADPLIVGDISGNGRINAADAALLAQAVSRMAVGEIPPVPGGIVRDGSHAPDPRLRVGGTLQGGPGDVVTVPIYLDSVEDLQAPHRLIGATLILGYDPQILTYVSNSAAPGHFMTTHPDWQIIAVNDRVPGQLIIVVISWDQPAGGLFSDEFVHASFQVNPGIASGVSTSLNLKEQAGAVRTELNDESDLILPLSPTPTDAGTDTVDGTMTVNSRFWQNARNPLDVSDDTQVTPLDVLLVINYINGHGAGALPSRRLAGEPLVDVNGDDTASASDVLQIINHLNSRVAAGSAEGEPLPSVEGAASTVPLIIREPSSAEAGLRIEARGNSLFPLPLERDLHASSARHGPLSLRVTAAEISAERIQTAMTAIFRECHQSRILPIEAEGVSEMEDIFDLLAHDVLEAVFTE